MRRLFCLTTLGLCLLTTGCGGSDEIETAAVEGKVTMDGQPVYPATITFSPAPSKGQTTAKGRPASASTEVDGTYSVPDAVVGYNVVGVMKEFTDQDSEEAEDSEMNIPLIGKPSRDNYLVESGSNTIDIQLVSPGT